MQQHWFDDKLLLIIGIPLIGAGFPLCYQLFIGAPTDVLLYNVAGSLISTLALWLGCRTLLNWVAVKLPWKEVPARRLVADIVLVSAYSLAVTAAMFWLLEVIPMPPHCYDYTFWESYFGTMSVSLIISFVHEGIYFFVQWKKAILMSEGLEKEHLLSQYETLKNQVNPHFLFNSFNTLITIIEEDKQQAVEYVEKLSDFFRTILQHRDKSVISLREELELIRNYYFIQQKRYGQNLDLQIHVEERLMDTAVAPLTLQMLLENAIKHNIISTEKKLKIEISVRDTDYIIIRNNLQKRHEPESGSGLGLENIKNKYRFLSEKEVEVIVTPLNFTVAIPVLHRLTK